jgi:hypothetical protein
MHHATQTCVGVKVQLHAFLRSVPDGGESLDSRPGRLSSREAPTNDWIGVWLAPGHV